MAGPETLKADEDAKSAKDVKAVAANAIAVQLLAALGSNDVAMIKACIDSAKGFTDDALTSLVADGKAVIAQMAMLSKTAAVAANDNGHAGMSEFDKAVYEKFTDKEKAYYDSLDPNKQYQIKHLDKDGKIVDDHRTVSGQDAKKSLIIVTYQAFSADEKAGLPTPEGTKAKLETVDDIEKFEKTLKTQQDVYTTRLIETGASQEQINKAKEVFDKANQKLEEMKQTKQAMQTNFGHIKIATTDNADNKTPLNPMEKAKQQAQTAAAATKYTIQSQDFDNSMKSIKKDFLDNGLDVKADGSTTSKFNVADVANTTKTFHPIQVVAQQQTTAVVTR